MHACITQKIWFSYRQNYRTWSKSFVFFSVSFSLELYSSKEITKTANWKIATTTTTTATSPKKDGIVNILIFVYSREKRSRHNVWTLHINLVIRTLARHFIYIFSRTLFSYFISTAAAATALSLSIHYYYYYLLSTLVFLFIQMKNICADGVLKKTKKKKIYRRKFLMKISFNTSPFFLQQTEKNGINWRKSLSKK